MSRTRRCKSGDRYWLTKSYKAIYVNDVYSWRRRNLSDDEILELRAQNEKDYDELCDVRTRDKHNFYRNCSSAVKWYTNYSRRAHLKHQLARFWKDPDEYYDIYDRKKKYLGYWWYYD